MMRTYRAVLATLSVAALLAVSSRRRRGDADVRSRGLPGQSRRGIESHDRDRRGERRMPDQLHRDLERGVLDAEPDPVPLLCKLYGLGVHQHDREQPRLHRALRGDKKESTDEYLGHLDFCPTGESLTLAAGTCAIRIENRKTWRRSISRTAQSRAKRVAVTFGISKLAYTVTKDGFLCPFGGTAGENRRDDDQRTVCAQGGQPEQDDRRARSLPQRRMIVRPRGRGFSGPSVELLDNSQAGLRRRLASGCRLGLSEFQRRRL